MIDEIRLGKILKKARTSKHLDIIDISEKTSISESTLKSIEAGKNCLKLETVLLICECLNLNLMDLLYSSQSDEYVYINELVNRIESKISFYNKKEILSEVSELESFVRSNGVKFDVDLHYLIEFYYLLISFANGDFITTKTELSKLLKSSIKTSSHYMIKVPVDEPRIKTLLASTYSALGDYSTAISLGNEIINTDIEPLSLSKARINLAKHNFANKNYLAAYELTLETINILYKNSIINKLQGAFWMKGICERRLNIDFQESLQQSVHIAHYSGLFRQRDNFIETARNEFGLEIPIHK